MKQYQTLTSEKYYIDKLETEAKVFRKLQARNTISDFVVSAIMLSTFAVCAYALYMNPSFIPDSIDYMRANDILSY